MEMTAVDLLTDWIVRIVLYVGGGCLIALAHREISRMWDERDWKGMRLVYGRHLHRVGILLFAVTLIDMPRSGLSPSMVMCLCTIGIGYWMAAGQDGRDETVSKTE